LPGQCFAGHEKFDLLWRGKKIAGAAQRRNKSGLLIQGSIQAPIISLARTNWEDAMVTVAREKFQVEWKELLPDEKLCARTDGLAREKYFQESYNRKR
jgi:lipoate-protein ligase A